MRIIIHNEAQAELQSIYIYYKSISILIANKFKEEVKSKYQFITENPKIYPTISQDIRKCNLDNYPYSILYSENGNNIKVLAFAHFKRKPNYWKNRK